MDTINSSLYTHYTNKTVIIGLSGGPDSVYLLYQLSALAQEKNIKLIAAHLNHEWRESADKDEQFCKELCTKLSIPFESKKISSMPAMQYNGSKEEQARNYRKVFFNETVNTYNADFIALAHHADDQIETFFIRLMRGTTHAGISGIKEIHEKYTHPLLSVSKQEILLWLKKNNISYVLDETNENETFLRNKVRKKIIPALKETDERYSKNITRFMKQSQYVHTFITDYAQAEQNKISGPLGIFIPRFQALHYVIQQQILTNLALKEKLPITLQESWFAECIRFLKTKKINMHNIAPGYSIKIQKNYFRFQKDI